MAELLDVHPGDYVLEPQAGKGDLADAIKRVHPDANVDVIEIDSTLHGVLDAKGHRLVDDNSFKYEGKRYDHIIMNPPFEAEEDIDHVLCAWERLREGGSMSVLMSEGSSKVPFFEDWLTKHADVALDLPESAFAGPDAFRKTVVRTRIFRLLKCDNDSHFDSSCVRVSSFCSSVAGLG